MSSEQNLTLVRRYFSECVNAINGPDRRRALALVDELMSADFSMFYNNEVAPAGERGRKRHKAFLVEHARDFTNDVWTIEELLADGDVVACRWRIRARYRKTGQPIDVRAADFFRVQDGRVVELRRFLDFESLLLQMKPVPPG
jgi:ketosteroid isomerase-like protein